MKKKTLEESFQQLDEIIAKLEREEVSLEESFALYNQGMTALKECNTAIDAVEKKLIVLNEEKM